MLIVYPRTNKQNQKKKRKVEPPTPQVTPGTHTRCHPVSCLPLRAMALLCSLERFPQGIRISSPLMLPVWRVRAGANQGSRSVQINSWSSLPGSHTPAFLAALGPRFASWVLFCGTKQSWEWPQSRMVPMGDQGEVLFMGHFVRNRMKFHRAPVTPFEMTPEIMGMKGKY